MPQNGHEDIRGSQTVRLRLLPSLTGGSLSNRPRREADRGARAGGTPCRSSRSLEPLLTWEPSSGNAVYVGGSWSGEGDAGKWTEAFQVFGKVSRVLGF